MHPIETKIKNTCLLRNDCHGLPLMPQLLLQRAHTILKGEECYKDIHLALEYYTKYLIYPDSIEDPAFSSYLDDKPIIDKIEALFKQGKHDEVLDLVKTLSTTEYGNVLSTIGLICYNKGDKAKASEFFHQASELGYPAAMRYLADMYLKGDGVPSNPLEGIRLLENASKLGSQSATHRLANIYFRGKHVPTDYAKAYAYYETLFDSSYAAHAIYTTGYMLEYGMGKPKDFNTAFERYQMASALGCDCGTLALGMVHLEKDLPVYDPKKGLEILQPLIDKNMPDAMVEAAFAYCEKTSIHQDVDRAFSLFKRASDLKNSEASLELGKWYHHGIHVVRSLDQALTYYELASEQGNEKATELAKELKASNPSKEWSGKQAADASDLRKRKSEEPAARPA